MNIPFFFTLWQLVCPIFHHEQALNRCWVPRCWLVLQNLWANFESTWQQNRQKNMDTKQIPSILKSISCRPPWPNEKTLEVFLQLGSHISCWGLVLQIGEECENSTDIMRTLTFHTNTSMQSNSFKDTWLFRSSCLPLYIVGSGHILCQADDKWCSQISSLRME